MPGIMLNPSGCCCAAPVVVNRWHVTNCAGSFAVGVPVATINVWTDFTKSTFCGSALTDSNGNASLVLSPIAFTYYFEVDAGPRYKLFTGTCPRTNIVKNVSLATQDGYVCSIWCRYPLSTTLHWSDGVFTPITLNYSAAGASGAGWYGTGTYDFPGCSNTIPYNYTCDPATLAGSAFVAAGVKTMFVSFVGGFVPPVGGFVACPGAGPPSFTLAYSVNPLNMTTTCDVFSISGTPNAVNCMPPAGILVTE